MLLTRRTGLIVIVGLAVLGGILVATTGAVADIQVGRALQEIQQRYLPKLKLATKLDGELEKISHAFQDAVASQDVTAFETARLRLDNVSEMLAAAQPGISSVNAATLRNAFKAHYTSGLDVARRLMANETGEPVLQAIQEMQEAEKHVTELIAAETGIDTEELDRAFAEIIATQTYAARMRLTIIVSFLTVIAIMAVFLASRLRVDEKRNEEMLAGAWSELEAFSAPRDERTEPTELTQLVRDSANLIRHAHPTPIVELVAPAGISAEIDPALARLLIEALLRHAWRSVAGQAAARVEFGLMTVGGQPYYFVRDNGESFDSATAKSLFTSQAAFGTLRTVRPELATAQRVVRRCGGRIWAERTPDEGSTVYFTLPGAPKPSV